MSAATALPLHNNKRSSDGDQHLGNSYDGRQNKKQDNKLTPRLSTDKSSGEPDSLPKQELNSYQLSFLSKYGTLPRAEPSGGIKWNKKAGLTESAMAKPPYKSQQTPETNSETTTNNDSKITLVEAAAASARKTEAANASKPPKKKNPTLGGGKWTKAEDAQLCQAVKAVGPKNWRRISAEFLQGRRSDVQCLHRWQKVLRPGLVKGPWTPSEDVIIIQSISEGMTKWSEIAERIPGRIGKQCRERWFNHLDPRIKKGPWNDEEDRILIEAQAKLGNRWCEIAKMLPGRSENNVKNRWNSAMRRRYQAKKANEDGSVNPPSPAKRRNRKKSDKKKKEKKSRKGTASRKNVNMNGPAPMEINNMHSMLPPPEPWSSPFGFGNNTQSGPHQQQQHQQHVGYKTNNGNGSSSSSSFRSDPAMIQGAPVPQGALSPVSRAFARRANAQQKAQNRSSLTERERQLMHQAFLAGAAVTRHGTTIPPTYQQDAKDGVQWNFSGSASTNSVDIPSIAAFSALGDGGRVHTDIDPSQRSPRNGSNNNNSSRNHNNHNNNNNNNKSSQRNGSNNSKFKDPNAMEISWGLGSVGNGNDGVEMLNSAEMADMSLSMLGLSIDINTSSATNNTKKLPQMSPTAIQLAEVSGEFKLGNITAEEKERRKEEIIAGGGEQGRMSRK